MKKQTAESVYDLLISECDAPEWDRDDFIAEMTKPKHKREWRLSNHVLGLGGKFWDIPGARLFIACEPMSETRERRALITRVNKQLISIEERLESLGNRDGSEDAAAAATR